MRKMILLVVVSLLLSGCMYPKEELAENQVAPQDQLNMVQQAITNYQKILEDYYRLKIGIHLMNCI